MQEPNRELKAAGDPVLGLPFGERDDESSVAGDQPADKVPEDGARKPADSPH